MTKSLAVRKAETEGNFDISAEVCSVQYMGPLPGDSCDTNGVD